MMMLAFDPARRSGKSAFTDAASALFPMTAARYLTLRRRAAGLSRAELATRLLDLAREGLRISVVGALQSPSEMRALVDLLEAEGTRARHRITIEALAAVIPLDVDVYFQLIEEPVERHPTVCRTCGCSHADPCRGEPGICDLGQGPPVCSGCSTGFLREVR